MFLGALSPSAGEDTRRVRGRTHAHASTHKDNTHTRTNATIRGDRFPLRGNGYRITTRAHARAHTHTYILVKSPTTAAAWLHSLAHDKFLSCIKTSSIQMMGRCAETMGKK